MENENAVPVGKVRWYLFRRWENKGSPSRGGEGFYWLFYSTWVGDPNWRIAKKEYLFWASAFVNNNPLPNELKMRRRRHAGGLSSVRRKRRYPPAPSNLEPVAGEGS